MRSLLIFLLAAIFLAYVLTGLIALNGEASVVIGGRQYDTTDGALLGLAIGLGLGLIAITIAVMRLADAPKRLRDNHERTQTARGLAALTRGLEAVAVGDGRDAAHHFRVVRRNLGDGPLTRLLAAQAAEVSGDDRAAGETFTAMLDAPETEFLGLRGLYDKAVREGDAEAARSYAERAFRLRPNAGWAFASVFDLALERGDWGDARAALAQAQKNGLVDAAAARRGEAALLAAAAYAADLSGDENGALEEAERALKIDPSLAPAATLDADLHAKAGRRQRAAKALEQAFARTPHRALVVELNAVFADASASARADALRRLAKRKPGALEADFAEAKALELLGDHEAAIDKLRPVLERQATARECALMGDAVRGLYGDAAARPWVERALEAPRDDAAGADGLFHLTREGWARLVREYMEHGRLAPPPLEGPPPGLTDDDIRLLSAPIAAIAPPADAPEPNGAAAAREETASDDGETSAAEKGADGGGAAEKAPGVNGVATQTQDAPATASAPGDDADAPKAAERT
ncbi:MAG: heme biosynthesis HemY N-terminal domain-containing protein [Parvularculaceae bacterium]